MRARFCAQDQVVTCVGQQASNGMACIHFGGGCTSINERAGRGCAVPGTVTSRIIRVFDGVPGQTDVVNLFVTTQLNTLSLNWVVQSI